MKTSTRKTIGRSALALAVGLGSVAFWAMRSKVATERRLMASRAEGERLSAAWRARQERAATSEATVDANVAAPVAPAAAAKPAFPPRTLGPGLTDLARDNPQLWTEFIQAKRIEMGRFFLPVMQRLNLTPAQRERVKDILADELARGADINTAGNAQGLPFEDPALAKLRADSNAQRKRELTDVLGTAGLKEFEDFERATPLRGAVNGFAVQVARSAPLTSQQADQLERALAQANAAYQRGEHGLAEAVDWDEADRSARAILTPQQFEIWKLGVAHNSFGGARIEQELHRVYDRALARAGQSAATNAVK
jgi:hypothetical protein